jgi:hypothetical protein
MAAISDYLENQLLNHLFRTSSFPKPSSIAIALTNGLVKDSDTGATLPEVPTGTPIGRPTGYSRISLGDPAVSGAFFWSNVGQDTVTTFSVYVNSGELVNFSNQSTLFNASSSSLSGYIYPLYTSESFAKSLSTTTPQQAYKFTFPNKYPSVELFAPIPSVQSGVQSDPGYTVYDGNGFIKNNVNLAFNEADTDWGDVSGIAILDSSVYGQGNVLMHSALSSPRTIRQADSVRFNIRSLEISLK